MKFSYLVKEVQDSIVEGWKVKWRQILEDEVIVDILVILDKFLVDCSYE